MVRPHRPSPAPLAGWSLPEAGIVRRARRHEVCPARGSVRWSAEGADDEEEARAMFQRLLVPVDLTAKNARAIEVARDLALETGGAVTLLHVIETLDLPFDELRDFYGRLEDKALSAMDEAVEPLRAAGVEFDAQVAYGKRAEEIVRFAEETGAELIILNSHRVDLENPGAGWATLSYKIAILAQCPVLLVKGGAD